MSTHSKKKKKKPYREEGEWLWLEDNTPPPAIFVVMVATRLSSSTPAFSRHEYISINQRRHSLTRSLTRWLQMRFTYLRQMSLGMPREKEARPVPHTSIHPSQSISLSFGNMISGDDDADRVRE